MNPNWVHKHGPKRLRRAMKKTFYRGKAYLKHRPSTSANNTANTDSAKNTKNSNRNTKAHNHKNQQSI